MLQILNCIMLNKIICSIVGTAWEFALPQSCVFLEFDLM